MTREEAIKHFESYIGNECYTHSHQEACRLAVAALRAQPAKLDRSRWEGCEWCENTGAVIIEQHHAFRSKRKRGSAVAIYCPSCGKPLTEDAWAELERRIGGNDGTTDSGLTPDEVAEYQHLCETYVEAGLDPKFVQICIDATRWGVTIEQIMKLGSSNDPLTLEELREMDGEPVWVVPLNDFEILPANYLVNAYAEQIVVDKFGAYLDFEDYGKTWLAYRRRPEEG